MEFNTWVQMIFALGFFSISMRVITRDHREARDRRLAEAREFGIEGMHELNNPKPSKKR